MKRGSSLVYLFFVWLVFVVSLATWWMIFSLGLIQQFHDQNPQADFQPQKTMLITEGTVLIVFLLFGGISLIYYSLREQKRLAEIQLFFSTFSHDLKTSITRLVLQGERLSKKYPEAEEFQKNLLVLEMQLENSLHLAQVEERGLILEPVDIKKIVARLHMQWPGLKINLQGKELFLGDQVAVESIFKNLISNSLLHGQADEIFLKVGKESSIVTVDYWDNSQLKIEQDLNTLGRTLQPSQKGSGMGLYIVSRWTAVQKSQLRFSAQASGALVVHFKFPAAAARSV